MIKTHLLDTKSFASYKLILNQMSVVWVWGEFWFFDKISWNFKNCAMLLDLVQNYWVFACFSGKFWLNHNFCAFVVWNKAFCCVILESCHRKKSVVTEKVVIEEISVLELNFFVSQFNHTVGWVMLSVCSSEKYFHNGF